MSEQTEEKVQAKGFSINISTEDTSINPIEPNKEGVKGVFLSSLPEIKIVEVEEGEGENKTIKKVEKVEFNFHQPSKKATHRATYNMPEDVDHWSNPANFDQIKRLCLAFATPESKNYTSYRPAVVDLIEAVRAKGDAVLKEECTLLLTYDRKTQRYVNFPNYCNIISTKINPKNVAASWDPEYHSDVKRENSGGGSGAGTIPQVDESQINDI